MRINKYFVFDGKDTRDWEVDVTGIATYSKPSRSIKTVSVPGRNGDLVFDNGNYENVPIKYGCKIYNKDEDYFENYFNDFADFLVTHQDKYYKLQDWYHQDVYRLAMVTGGIDPQVVENINGSVYASFDVTFSCKPQRYLVSGDEFIDIINSVSIINPTRQTALPLIRVYSTHGGEIAVGDKNIVIKAGANAYIDIDCDLHTITEGDEIRSDLVVMRDGFPSLNGETIITFNEGISKVELQPRWWKT